jgi:galactokinase
MDMLISLAGCQGHALLLDCERMTWEEVPFPEEGRLLVIDTGVRHDHSSGAYAQRHRECQEAASVLGVESLAQAGVDAATHGGLSCTLRSRALHVVSECRRVREFAVAMEAGDLSRMGRLLTESHLSLRDHFEVSTPELDHVVAMSEALRGEGVLGARLTGGGFGGCAIVLLRREAARTAATELSEAYERRFKRRPSMFMAEASAGAEWLFSVD